MFNPPSGLSSPELFEYYYYIVRVITRVSGVIPLDENTPYGKWKSIFLFIFINVGLFLIFVPHTIASFTLPTTLNQAIDVADINFIVINIWSKLAVLAYHKETLLKIQENIKKLWGETSCAEEIAELKSFANKGKITTMCYITFCVLVTVGYTTLPLLGSIDGFENESKLPFRIGRRIESKLHLTILYLAQVIAMLVNCMVVVGGDMIVPVLLFHICGHFKVMQMKILKIDRDCPNSIKLRNNYRASDTNTPTPSDASALTYNSYVESRLAECIEHHQLLLNIWADMERAFNLIGLIQAISGVYSVFISGAGLLIIEGQKLKYIPHLITAFLQMLAFCLPADNLMEESSKVSHAAFSLPWYNCSLKVQNNILYMMSRAQDCCRYSAGKFFVLSLVVYTTIVSNGVSALTVLSKVI
ncbi:uncharacterized protein LOC110116997 isoform X2 [Athalia rosae]|uniref:uncharacterized protein LOC110116997 isoform X2 n=1 Tax=Athalia rosae TaxID=37344 RepID=UPI0020338355|nr:uncharacterized protein LOC110116997 isoform X2 [Athalia rosae]